jgi:hypothetical protein
MRRSIVQSIPHRGRLSTVDLHLPTILEQSLLILKILFPFYKTSYLNEEVNCTEHSLTISREVSLNGKAQYS